MDADENADSVPPADAEARRQREQEQDLARVVRVPRSARGDLPRHKTEVIRPMEKPEAYSALLTKCTTLEQLKGHVLAYEELALDAVEIVHRMTPADFKEFRAGLKKERRDVFAGEPWAKRFAAVLMPEPMFTIALIADEYKVPFVIAHLRIKEVRPELLELRPAVAAVDPHV